MSWTTTIAIGAAAFYLGSALTIRALERYGLINL